jgi:integrase
MGPVLGSGESKARRVALSTADSERISERRGTGGGSFIDKSCSGSRVGKRALTGRAFASTWTRFAGIQSAHAFRHTGVEAGRV